MVIVLFCNSAGVGRTGTLIVVDVELQRARKEHVIDTFGTVMRLRENRSNIVQTEVQYYQNNEFKKEVGIDIHNKK